MTLPPPPPGPVPPAAQYPYGGWAAAPAPVPGGVPMAGSLADVETRIGPVAGFGDRLLAYLVDSLVVLVSFLPMLAGIPFLVAGVPDRTGTDASGYATYGNVDATMLTIAIVLFGLGALFAFAVNLWNRVLRMGRRGQSLGKSALGLWLVGTRTGRPIGAANCFVRELVSGVVNQVVNLSSLWMLWDPDHQTLADKVVSSTVVKLPKA